MNSDDIEVKSLSQTFAYQWNTDKMGHRIKFDMLEPNQAVKKKITEQKRPKSRKRSIQK